MNDIDGRTPSGEREADQRPAEIRGRMRPLGDVAYAGWQRARTVTSERDDRERLPERQQGACEAVDVTTDTSRWRGKRAAVNTDP